MLVNYQFGGYVSHLRIWIGLSMVLEKKGMRVYQMLPEVPVLRGCRPYRGRPVPEIRTRRQRTAASAGHRGNTFRKSASIIFLNLELNFTLWSYTIDLSLSYIGGLFYDVKFQPYILLDTYLVANSANAEPMPFLSTYPDAKFLSLCIYFSMVSCS